MGALYSFLWPTSNALFYLTVIDPFLEVRGIEHGAEVISIGIAFELLVRMVHGEQGVILQHLKVPGEHTLWIGIAKDQLEQLAWFQIDRFVQPMMIVRLDGTTVAFFYRVRFVKMLRHKPSLVNQGRTGSSEKARYLVRVDVLLDTVLHVHAVGSTEEQKLGARVLMHNQHSAHRFRVVLLDRFDDA
uniref:Putative secreted protein n=1 Tax=Anopheles darlingi TaxID=43151 RepID=A0A2M4DCP3_ANODA